MADKRFDDSLREFIAEIGELDIPRSSDRLRPSSRTGLESGERSASRMQNAEPEAEILVEQQLHAAIRTPRSRSAAYDKQARMSSSVSSG